jgi:replicative DNA helicase
MSDLRECVTGDTLVCLSDGRRVPIQDLVGQTPEVVSMTPDGRITRAKSDLVWRVGKKPVYEVKLASGRKIRATGKHRLYCSYGWQEVSDLRPGDRLAVAGMFPEAQNPEIWPEYFMQQQGIARSGMAAMGNRPNVSFIHCPSRATMSEYGRLPADEYLQRASTSDLFWDRIVSVELRGEQEVFDITVPGTASWLADGVVSHNSGSIEQDADMILLIYREEVYDRNTTKKGIAEIDLVKHRNGEIGTFILTFQGQFTRFANYVPDSYAEGVLR